MLLMAVDGMRFILMMCRMVHRRCPGGVVRVSHGVHASVHNQTSRHAGFVRAIAWFASGMAGVYCN
jgi:hypothetical protein